MYVELEIEEDLMIKKPVLTNRLWIVALLVGLCNIYQAFPVFAATPAPILTVQSSARVGEQVPLRVDFYGHSVYLASSYGWIVYSKPDGCITNQFLALDCRYSTTQQRSLTFVIGFPTAGSHQLNVTNYGIEPGEPNNGIAREVYVNPALTATPTLTPTPTSTPTATPTVTSTNVPQPVCFIDVLYGQNYAAVTYISNLDVQKSEIRNSSGQVVFTGNAANANTPTSLFHFNPSVGVTYTVWTKTAHPMEWNACTPSYTREAATSTPSVTPTLTATPTSTPTENIVHCNFISIGWNVNMKVNVAVSFDQQVDGWGWFNADHSIHVSYSGQTPANEIISFEADYRYGEIYKFGVVFNNEDQICGTFPAPQAPTPSSTATPTATSTPLVGLTPGTPVPPSTSTPTLTPTSTSTTVVVPITPPASATPTATVTPLPIRMAIVGIVNSNLSVQAQGVPVVLVVTDQGNAANSFEKTVDGISEQQYLYSPPAGSNQVLLVTIDPKGNFGMREEKVFYVVNGIVQLSPPVTGSQIFLPFVTR